jgi:hypothetical protein
MLPVPIYIGVERHLQFTWIQEKMFLNCPLQLRLPIVNYPTYSLMRKCYAAVETGYQILDVDGSEEMYDNIIFCLHAPDALKVLGAEATLDELRILGAFKYINR